MTNETTDTIEDLKKLDEREPFFERHWRAQAATIYLIICMFDFVGMPIIKYFDYAERKHTVKELLKDHTDIMTSISLINSVPEYQWEPLTLKNGGLFHVSFGAILTGAVLMRGQERKVTIQNGNGNN